MLDNKKKKRNKKLLQGCKIQGDKKNIEPLERKNKADIVA